MDRPSVRDWAVGIVKVWRAFCVSEPCQELVRAPSPLSVRQVCSPFIRSGVTPHYISMLCLDKISALPLYSRAHKGVHMSYVLIAISGVNVGLYYVNKSIPVIRSKQPLPSISMMDLLPPSDVTKNTMSLQPVPASIVAMRHTVLS